MLIYILILLGKETAWCIKGLFYTPWKQPETTMDLATYWVASLELILFKKFGNFLPISLPIVAHAGLLENFLRSRLADISIV